MARKLYNNKLIDKTDIKEEMILIEESNTDYITKSGKVYKYYGNNKFYPKKNYLNQHNGYLYCGITDKNGVNHHRRVHILVARAFIPNPYNYPYVCHNDNNKANPDVSNLRWDTPSNNSQQAHDDKLIVNDKGYDDSQSNPIYCFNRNKQLIKDYGSIREAHKELGVSISTISRHCKHQVKSTRCGYYFRYQSEYDEKGFVL